MHTQAQLIASVAALIPSLALAWVALHGVDINGIDVSVNHNGGLTLENASAEKFEIRLDRY